MSDKLQVVDDHASATLSAATKLKFAGLFIFKDWKRAAAAHAAVRYHLRAGAQLCATRFF